MKWQQFKALWDNLKPQQQRMIVGLGLVTVLAGGALVYWGQRPNYGILYSDLSATDAGQIVEYLRSQRQPYQLAAGGGTIEVDQGQVYALRLALAQEGLPKGTSGVGFEIFDKSALPGSEFSNQVAYQRAVQGELDRTIGSLDEIKLARVHVVLPKTDLYSGPQGASASVMIETRGGQQLSGQEIDGIVHLVASAVQGLKPETITLIDAKGAILSEAAPAKGTRLSASQRKASQEYEEELRRALQVLLDQSLGEHNSIIQVQAELDFDEQTIHRQSVTPAKGPGSILAEEVSRETYAGNPSAGAATAGVSPNINVPGTGLGSGAAGTYTNQ
jgi:flagellar M-ring protein FliF